MAYEDYKIVDIVTPENVYLELRLAKVGERISAFITDVLILIGSTIVLVIVSSLVNAMLRSISTTLFFFGQAFLMIALFVLWNGYFIFFELKNGNTPGKKRYNYQVIREDGTALSAGAIYLRNLLREIEIWMPLRLVFTAIALSWTSHWAYPLTFLWILLFTLFPFFDKKGRRLGDLLAGTMVIVMPKYSLEEDLTTKAQHQRTQKAFNFSSEMLDIYGKEELQVLEKILRNRHKMKGKDRQELLATVVAKIIKKIGYPDPIASSEHQDFLQQFYQSQRQVLEKKLVRGENLQRKTRRWIKKVTPEKWKKK